MMIFILVPAIAPNLGQAVMYLASWREIFLLYVFYSVVIRAMDHVAPGRDFAASHPSRLRLGPFCTVLKSSPVIAQRGSIPLCMGLCLRQLHWLPRRLATNFSGSVRHRRCAFFYFGGLALVLGVASLLNSRIVGRVGMRLICLRAMAVIVLASVVFLAVQMAITTVTLWMFVIYAAVLFFLIWVDVRQSERHRHGADGRGGGHGVGDYGGGIVGSITCSRNGNWSDVRLYADTHYLRLLGLGSIAWILMKVEQRWHLKTLPQA